MRQDQFYLFVLTGYNFRGLDLYKALFGEGVSEELAHSRLQAKDGLAGGRLLGGGRKHTNGECHYHIWCDWIYYTIITDV